MNTWNLEGMKVEGLYLGEIPVAGKVHLSRVQYGGGISHHVQLDTPVSIYGTMRDTVTLEHKFVTACKDLNT